MVEEGDQVVLDVNNGEKVVITQVTKKARIKLGRSYVSCLPLLGQTYGTVFELSADGRTLVGGSKNALDVLNGDFKNTSTERNNEKLVDDGTAQKLTQKDIEQLKGDGITGGELINKLVENSATFKMKTEFSQEKYKKRKQKKYCTVLVLCRPCAQNICEAFYQKSPFKICGLRLDSLSLLLNLGNVCPYSRVLVLEESGGMILASALERLGGYGQVCALSMDAKRPAPKDIVRFFNFEEHVTAAGRHTSLEELLKAKEVKTIEDCGEVPEESKQEGDDEGKSSEGNPRKKMKVSRNHGALKRVFMPKRAETSELEELASAGFDSLIVVAPRYSPESVMDKLASLLAPSAAFAVFSPYLQPLVDCRYSLSSQKAAVSLQLTETFWREHQVLPGRTHPNMNMTTGPTSGYILSGVMTQNLP